MPQTKPVEKHFNALEASQTSHPSQNSLPPAKRLSNEAHLPTMWIPLVLAEHFPQRRPISPMT